MTRFVAYFVCADWLINVRVTLRSSVQRLLNSLWEYTLHIIVRWWTALVYSVFFVCDSNHFVWQLVSPVCSINFNSFDFGCWVLFIFIVASSSRQHFRCSWFFVMPIFMLLCLLLFVFECVMNFLFILIIFVIVSSHSFTLSVTWHTPF